MLREIYQKVSSCNIKLLYYSSVSYVGNMNLHSHMKHLIHKSHALTSSRFFKLSANSELMGTAKLLYCCL